MFLINILWNTFGNIILVVLVIAIIFFIIYFKTKPYHAAWLYAKDLKKLDKDEYPNYGFTLYCGKVGTGKTLSMVEYGKRMKEKYPKLYIVSNFECSYSDLVTNEWVDVVMASNPNGKKYGVLLMLDEVHLTLASDGWKNAPDNIMELMSMNRKSHRQIVASSQVFERINIKLREQSNVVIECNTIFKGRWVFNKAYDTVDYIVNGDLKDNGVRKRKRKYRYNFVATDQIRNQYDTMQLMESMAYQKGSITLEDMIDNIIQQRNS